MNLNEGNTDERSYTIEVDGISKDQWDNIIQNFADATIYQTCSYGAIRWGKENLSHLVLMKKGEIAAAAQVRIVFFPLFGSHIAYIARGPMWRLRRENRKYGIFRRMVRALQDEYMSKRGLFVRLVPNEFENETDRLQQILKQEGFQSQSSTSPYRTILNDLNPSLEELRKNLHKRWREKLNRALREDLEVIEGTEDNLYGTFVTLYKEMCARKKFVSYVDINEFRAIQNNLPRALKMNIMICKFQGTAVAALVWSAIGDTGITIFSATGNKCLKSYGSYLLRWKMLERLKERGCRFLDQGGVNLQNNPGGYHFKADMGGMEICNIGQFNACRSMTKSALIRIGENCRNKIRWLNSNSTDLFIL